MIPELKVRIDELEKARDASCKEEVERVRKEVVQTHQAGNGRD